MTPFPFTSRTQAGIVGVAVGVAVLVGVGVLVGVAVALGVGVGPGAPRADVVKLSTPWLLAAYSPPASGLSMTVWMLPFWLTARL
jgi:hypothetical protein